MKVLFTNFHPFDGGGHTSYILSLFREFNLREIDAFVACPATSKLNIAAQKIRPEHVRDIDFPGKIREARQIIDSLKKTVSLLKKTDFDLIHVNGSPDHRMIIYAKILLGSKTPILKTLHNSLRPKTDLSARIRRRLFEDHTIIVSDYQRQLALDGGYREKDVTVIKNGIDTNYYYFAPVNKALRGKFDIGINDFVFVSTAGTDVSKGWPLLVEAVSRLSSKGRIKILLAGEVPDRSAIDEYVKKFDMSAQVIFTGRLADVREVVSIADVGFVLSYNIETISYACREMMAMGKPVLVSDYAGLPENIDDGINGWTTKTRDIESIYCKVKEILTYEEHNIENFSKTARVKAENEFGLEQFVNNTYACYKKIINR
ncbi:MAG: glycosyltransferase family 4 protein [Nitrospirae bacterium]|nr:glycosyltransferase family 4 protein [Nitrospirota bacterium]